MSNQSIYMLVIFVLFIGVFYFMAIRPQSKRRREHQEMMSTLKKGDQVMTGSGIYGTVKRVEDRIVVIEIAKGVTMKVVRQAIQDIIRDPEKAKAVAPEGTATRSRATRKPKSSGSVSMKSEVVEDTEGDDDSE